MKKFNYYYDYSPENYNYIMSSKILRQSEKDLLKKMVEGKTVKELAIEYECCCNLRAQGIENTQKILDAMNQNTIDDLRSQVNDLKNTITANGIGTSIVNQVRPFPQPAYITASPYQSIYTPYYNGCGCGNSNVF